MIEGEFNSWLENHLAAFPGIKPWAKRMGNPDAIMASWFRVLRDVDVADAMKVTEEWASGDRDPPKGFSDHARILRSICKNISAQRTYSTRKTIDGQPTVKCPDCLDSGYCKVFHPNEMASAAAGTVKREWGDCVHRGPTYRCDCEAGRKRQNEGVARLDRKRMVPMLRGSIDDAFDRLELHIAKCKSAGGLLANQEF